MASFIMIELRRPLNLQLQELLQFVHAEMPSLEEKQFCTSALKFLDRFHGTNWGDKYSTLKEEKKGIVNWGEIDDNFLSKIESSNQYLRGVQRISKLLQNVLETNQDKRTQNRIYVFAQSATEVHRVREKHSKHKENDEGHSAALNTWHQLSKDLFHCAKKYQTCANTTFNTIEPMEWERVEPNNKPSKNKSNTEVNKDPVRPSKPGSGKKHASKKNYKILAADTTILSDSEEKFSAIQLTNMQNATIKNVQNLTEVDDVFSQSFLDTHTEKIPVFICFMLILCTICVYLKYSTFKLT